MLCNFRTNVSGEQSQEIIWCDKPQLNTEETQIWGNEITAVDAMWELFPFLHNL